MTQPDKPSPEITLPGIKDTFFPTTWPDGKQPVYYCHWCDAMPDVNEGQIAVIANHDACLDQRLKAIINADPDGIVAQIFNK